MTDPKLPLLSSLPPALQECIDMMEDEDQEMFERHREYCFYAGYRAGQSSAEPMTREQAVALINEQLKQSKNAVDAVIEASRRAPFADHRAVPEGHKIVPLEPTTEMWFRGRKAFLTSAGDLCRAHSADRASTHADIAPTEIYRAMLAAAPTPPAGEQPAQAERRLLARIRSEIRAGWNSYGQREIEGSDHLPMFGPEMVEEIDRVLATPPKGRQE